MPTTNTKHELSWKKKLGFSAATTLLFFVVIESGLSLLGLPRESISPDPFVGFTTSVPLYVPIDHPSNAEVLETNPAKLRWFNKQSFSRTKPKGTFRIVCLGGSTTFGRPFDDSTSFAGWMRRLLPKVDSHRRWEVINAGGISYASYRVAMVMEQMAPYEVDLWVLYCGQNEFLEQRTYGGFIDGTDIDFNANRLMNFFRIGRVVNQWADQSFLQSRSSDNRIAMPGEVDEMLNHSIGPESYSRDLRWHRGVQRHFQINLQRMALIAGNSGSSLVIVRPISNLRSCGPFKSDFGSAIPDIARAEVERKLSDARKNAREHNWDSVLDQVNELRKFGPEHAEVEYLHGQYLFATGDFDGAEVAFQNAIDQDICPLRATSGIRAVIDRFVLQNEVVDVNLPLALREWLMQKTGHGCLGDESFLDHVHPTIEVHGQIALQILAGLKKTGILERVPNDQEMEEVGHLIIQSIDGHAQGVAFRNLAKVFHWAGKWDEAARHAQRALVLLPNDMESRYVLAECLAERGQIKSAIATYEEMFQLGSYPRALIPFAALLADQQHYTAAQSYLIEATLDTNAHRRRDAYQMLGRIHELLGEDRLAEQCFQMADKIPDTSAETTQGP